MSNRYDVEELEALTDIMLDEEGNFAISADGDLQLAKGVQVVIQDIKNELETYPKKLFYDEDFGSGLLDFVNLQGTEINRLELAQKVITVIARNSQVDANTIDCNINSWSLDGIELEAVFNINNEIIRLDIGIGNEITLKVVNE